MNALVALWLLGVSPALCTDFEFESTDDSSMPGQNLVCHSDGVTYDAEHYALGDKAHDGRIYEITVWR